MDLDTKWLKDFLALAQTRNFSRAAELRHVTQPAFSRRIKALEHQLGCKLVSRLYQPLRLTEQGAIFEKSAEKIVRELEESYRELSQSLDSGLILNFAATHTLSLGIFPTLAQHINQLPFKVDTRLDVADADDCVKLLTSDRCDYLLAFSDPILAAHQQDSILLGQIKLLPVCKADSQGQPIYRLTDTGQTTPYLAYQNNIYLGRVVNQLIRKHRQALNVRRTLESPMADSLKMMAIKGLGVAWIPEFSIQQELSQGQLVLCGPQQWQPALEVRIYRHQINKKELEPIWQSLKEVNI